MLRALQLRSRAGLGETGWRETGWRQAGLPRAPQTPPRAGWLHLQPPPASPASSIPLLTACTTVRFCPPNAYWIVRFCEGGEQILFISAHPQPLTQKVPHKCMLGSCFQAPARPPPPRSAAMPGWLRPREQKSRAEPASPAAFTSRGWHRARATGSSGTRAGPLSPSRSAPGRTLSVSPCDGTSACGENNSHISTDCSWGANCRSNVPSTSLGARPPG